MDPVPTVAELRHPAIEDTDGSRIRLYPGRPGVGWLPEFTGARPSHP
ncbi:hypothetical protein ACQSSU_22490 [Micromonospora echinospora]